MVAQPNPRTLDQPDSCRRSAGESDSKQHMGRTRDVRDGVEAVLVSELGHAPPTLARTPKGIASFSWGAKVMGMALPFQKDLLLAPHERGLVGHVAAAGVEREQPVVREVKVSEIPETLAVAGRIDRAGGRLEQRFTFIALPDGRSVYADRITPVDGAAAEEVTLQLGTLGILNDPTWPYHDGSRTLHHPGGKHTFVAADAAGAAPVELDSRWYNLDDELGIVCLETGGRQVYAPEPTAARGRLEQLFHLNVRSPGQARTQTAIIFYPGRTAAETATLAEACRLEAGEADERFAIVLDDGLRLEIDLAALTSRKSQ